MLVAGSALRKQYLLIQTRVLNNYCSFTAFLHPLFYCIVYALSRTTRITDGKLQYHGKKSEDRCSHFRKNAWNRLRFFLNDRYVLHLISPEKIFSSQGTDCPEIGHDRARLLFLKTWTTPIFVHLKYIRLHSTLKLLMFYDGGRIVLTISIIGNDINTLIRSEEQKN